MKNDFDVKMISKLVRHCNYINRLLEDGLDMENTFEMKVVVDDQIYKVDQEVQVNDEEFTQVQKPQVDKMIELAAIIKEHLINLRSRSNSILKSNSGKSGLILN